MKSLIYGPLLAAVIVNLGSSVGSNPVLSSISTREHDVKTFDFSTSESWNRLEVRSPVIKPPRLGGDHDGEDGGEGTGNGSGRDRGDGSDAPTTQPGNPDDAPPRLGAGDNVGSDVAAIDNLGPLLPDTNPPRDINAFIAKADKVDTVVRAKFNDPAAKDNEFAPLEENYNVITDGPKILHGADDIKDALAQVGIDVDTTRQWGGQVRSKAGTSVDDVASARHYDISGKDGSTDVADNKGTIVGENRFQEADQNPRDKQLRPSDITFLLWQKYASHKNRAGNQMRNTKDDTGRFRNFVGRNIQSPSTVRSILLAHKNTGQSLGQRGVFLRSDTDPVKQQEFKRLCGTDFISSLSYMVMDHSQVLGKLEVKEIYTWPRNYDTTSKTGRQKHTALVVFGPYTP